MLVLKGNAFYEIDERMHAKKRTQISGRGGGGAPTPPKEEKNQRKAR